MAMQSRSRRPDPIAFAGPLPIPVVPGPSSREEWEYRRIERNLRTEEPPTEQELETLGKDGWELVGMFFDSPLLYLYFKRPA
jgi:hypothetical protein